MLQLRSISLVLGTMLAITVVTTGMAQDDKARAVQERVEIMKGLWSGYYRDFSQIARGESTNLAAVPDKARQASATVKRVGTLFPAGTAQGEVPGTRSKPEIWSDSAGFQAAIATLAAETEQLAQVAAAGDLDAYKAQFAKVSQACGACHGGPARSGGKYRFETQ